MRVRLLLLAIALLVLLVLVSPAMGYLSVKEIPTYIPGDEGGLPVPLFTSGTLYQTVPVGRPIVVDGPSGHYSFQDSNLPLSGLVAPGSYEIFIGQAEGWENEGVTTIETIPGHHYYVTINPVINKWYWIS